MAMRALELSTLPSAVCSRTQSGTNRWIRSATSSWLAAGRWLGLLARSRSAPSSLQSVASEYAVPVLPLADAVRSGVLAEFGLCDQQLERTRSVLAR